MMREEYAMYVAVQQRLHTLRQFPALDHRFKEALVAWSGWDGVSLPTESPARVPQLVFPCDNDKKLCMSVMGHPKFQTHGVGVPFNDSLARSTSVISPAF
jgi:hypothetical protein